MGAAALVVALSATTVVVTAAPAEAAVVRPFTLNYNQEVFGDYILAGNGNSVCPGASAPTDPFGEPNATCATAQARTYTAASGINDSYYMQWADVDSSAATYNSSQATITIPSGATVAFARLNWSGNTGTIRLADGTVSALPGCNTRQFLAGAGTSVLPAGTPESTSTRLTVGSATTSTVPPQVISRDALASVPASQPQFYDAYATVTAQFANAPTGTPLPITLGNVWTPQGFGCYSGWSLTVVYAYDAPNPNAPNKKEVFVYDGHVRQSSIDPATTVTVSGFQAASTGARVGVTGFEGDFNISGDRFSANGTTVAEPATAATTNFFVSNTDFASSPAVANNMSVDAKSIAVGVATGATSLPLTFSTSGDTFLASGLVVSVPTASLAVTQAVVSSGPYFPGSPVTYQVTVTSPGASATAVSVDSSVADCDRALGTLAPDVPVIYTCTGPAAADDFTVTTAVAGTSEGGSALSASTSTSVVVANPAVEITKTADQASYTAGQTIVFTIGVRNSGDEPLSTVTVSDPAVPACDSTRPALAVGASVSYTCTATAPIADDANTATVTAIGAGITVTDTATAAAPTLGDVSGRVFADLDNNGVVDTGDTGIAGVTITLAGPVVYRTTTTGSDGAYSFAGVAAGSYTVAETQPAAFDDGIDTPGTNAAANGNDAVTVTLAAGQSSTGTLFAELPTSRIQGSVYADANGNGTRNAGEAGIGGVTVSLSGQDSAGNTVALSTTTASDGGYSFAALRAGSYAVTETQPDGYGDGTATAGSAGGTASAANSITGILLPARANATGYTFGDTVGALSGAVYVDADGDGVRDAGETGIAGVTVRLTGSTASGAIAPATATTTGTGDYSFAGLLAGTYTVTETQPAAYGDGAVTAGSAGGTAGTNTVTGIVLAAGSSGSGYLFGERTGSIAGAAFHDVNLDGIRQADEPGIAGVTVTVTGTNVLGAGVSIATTTTATGAYLVGGLLAGEYTVTESQPADYGNGTAVAGTSGGTAGANAVSAIILAAGVNATGYLFGDTTGALSGAVYSDLDGSGARDAGEPGIGGVTVTLTGTDADGDIVPVATVTGANGLYSFTGLLAGAYAITETQPAGYGDGALAVGSSGGTAGSNAVTGIALAAGTTGSDYLFGETTGSIAGAVFHDLDRNGVRDAGEPGIEGVTVALSGTDVLGDAADATAETTADGAYAFPGLLAGSYTLTETQPAGYADGTDTAGTAGGTTSGTDSITAIDLEGGEDASGYLFGEERGSIGGRVWLDADGDGVDDATAGDEPGVEGVTATLFDADGETVATDTTDADGAYGFDALPAGSYRIGVDPGTGRVLTLPGQGDAETGSDVDWISGLSDELTIELDGVSATNLTAIDAGIADRVDDLAVELTAPEAVTVGGSVQFRALVANRGNSPVSGAVLTVTVPAGVQLDAAAGDDWTCTVEGRTATCETSTLVLPGDVLSEVTVSGLAVSAGEGAASATVAFSDGTVDSNGSDNTSAGVLAIAAVAVPPATTPAATPARAGLAFTGAEIAPVLAFALLLLAGGALVLVRRRRTAR